MKKLLIFGVIILFIGLAFIPSFNAASISKRIENGDTRTIKVECLCDFYFNTPGYYVQGVIVKLRSKYGLINEIRISDPSGNCYFANIPVYYNKTNLNIDTKHLFNGYRADYIKWINDDRVIIYFLVNWNKPKDDNILENIPKVNLVNQDISDIENDCDCQSNGKTHLAEKLLNRLEKDKVLSNVINSNNPDNEKPICKFLNKTYQKYHDFFLYLLYLADTLPYGSKIKEIYALTAYIIATVVLGYIFNLAYKFNCFEFVS